jgi:hypothetical protein
MKRCSNCFQITVLPRTSQNEGVPDYLVLAAALSSQLLHNRIGERVAELVHLRIAGFIVKA